MKFWFQNIRNTNQYYQEKKEEIRTWERERRAEKMVGGGRRTVGDGRSFDFKSFGGLLLGWDTVMIVFFWEDCDDCWIRVEWIELEKL